jgi:hypothetical protein
MVATATKSERNRPHDAAPAAPSGAGRRLGRSGWIALAGGLASLVAILGWFELTSYRHVVALVCGGPAAAAVAGPASEAAAGPEPRPAPSGTATGTGTATGGESAAEANDEVPSRPVPAAQRERGRLAAQRTVELERFEARLRSCRAKQNTVTCDFLLAATWRDVTVFLRGSSRLIDFAGNESLAASLAFGQNRRDEAHGYYSTVQNRLVVGVPTSIRIRFDHVSLEGGGAALVELVLASSEGRVNVQFRNVAVER